MKHLGARLVVLLVRGYQLLISPVLGPRCRFHPSCSHYVIEAVQTHGVIVGLWLGIRRLLRCHPLHPGGYDPVPPAKHAAPCCSHRDTEKQTKP